MKTKIINILEHPPAYENYKDERPLINWDTPGGNWVGIWGSDFSNQVGTEILKITDEFDYEVWQPDHRADKIYSYRFKSGLVHKLFPSEKMQSIMDFNRSKHISSSLLINSISQEHHPILHINNVFNYMNYLILKKFNLPCLVRFASRAHHPAFDIFRKRKNFLKSIHHFLLNRILSQRKCYYVYNNSILKRELTSIKSVGVKRLFMGVNFDEFKKQDSIISRKRFNLPESKKILLMASRFIPIKQIDKVIKILIDISETYDFYLVIAGSGDKQYEKYLHQLAAPLLKQNKVSFPGYLKNDDLMNAYSAADLFISASWAEGGPGSVVKTIASETPVMCTRVGGVDDFLASYEAGILVDPFNYDQWREKLTKFLDAKSVSVKLMNREAAKEYFHWPNIAQEFVKIYRQLNKIQF